MGKVCLNVGMAITFLTCFTCVSPHIFAADGELACKGKIVDAQGDAIPAAHVFLYEMSYDMTTFDIQRTLVQQTTSDEAGDFILSSERSASEFQRWAIVLVAKKGMGVRWSSWDLRNAKTMTIRLGGYGQLSGQVIDENGQPAVHASVRALLMLPAENTLEINYFDWLTQKTDEMGRFTFDFIPPDTTAEFYIEAGEEKNYCTATQGIAGGILSYTPDQQNLRIVLSDSLAMNNAQHSISYGALLANSRFLQIASRHFADSAAPETSPVNVKTQSISGMIIEEPFVPVSGVKIVFYDVFKDAAQPFGFTLKSVGETQTDTSGRYSFQRTDYDPKIDHSLMVAYKEGYSLFVTSFLFTDDDLEPLMMEYGHKEYSGIVVDSDGNPVSGAKVSAYVSSFIKPDSFLVSNPQEKEAAETDWLTATTDGNGQFLISNIPPFAKAEFSIKAEGYSTQYTWQTNMPLDEMTIPAGGNPLLFTLEKICAIQGRLMEESTNAGIPHEKIFIIKNDGRNHSGAVWSASSGSHAAKDLEGNNREITTGPEGEFAVDHLAPGSYKISLDPFTSDDRKWYAPAQTIDIAEGQTAEVTVPAVQCGTVTILVQNTDKQPMEGANVTLKPVMGQAKEQPQKEKRTDIQSLNSVTFVPAGSSEAQVLFQVANPSGDTILPARTDKEGAVVFHLAPGDYMIESVGKTDYEYLRDEQTITVQSGINSDAIVNMRHLPGFQGLCVDSFDQAGPGVDIRQLGFSDDISRTNREGRFHFSRESIKQITPIQTRLLVMDTVCPECKIEYRNRMVPQRMILLGMDSGAQRGGWVTYDWQKDFRLELKPTIQVIGKVFDFDGNPIFSSVRLYAYPDRISRTFYLSTFREKDFFFYDEMQTTRDGTFQFQLIPDFSYILEVTAEGYGKILKKIISSKYDPQITKMIKGDSDCIVTKIATPIGEPQVEKIFDIVWVLRDEKKQLDFGPMTLLLRNQMLSGIVVDRMGNPLEGYHIFVSGNEQVDQDSNVVTDSSGHFLVPDLCKGRVDIEAYNGEYDVSQRDVEVGRDDLRIVSPDHPVSQKVAETHSDSSLCDVEIILVNQDTRERIVYARAEVKVSPENGDSFHIKPDDNGRYRTRLAEGLYEIDVNAYPAYHYANDIKARIGSDVENNISIFLQKYPVIGGIVHLPESVSVDEIEVDIQPEALLSIFDGDWEIAGDGQFLCKLSLSEFNGQMATHGWLWICTKDKKYVSRTKFSLNENWVDVTLVPGATVKFKRSKQHASIFTWGWDQEEYNNYHTWSIGRSPTKDVLVQDDGFMGVQGLVAGQEDLTYTFMIGGVHKKIGVNSGDLEPGQTKIVEIPSL